MLFTLMLCSVASLSSILLSTLIFSISLIAGEKAEGISLTNFLLFLSLNKFML